jgi:hypothetical protein
MADEWWYCLKHNKVEGRDGCAQTHRMGPYASRIEAERALETAAERTEAWDNDPTWNDDADEAGEQR